MQVLQGTSFNGYDLDWVQVYLGTDLLGWVDMGTIWPILVSHWYQTGITLISNQYQTNIKTSIAHIKLGWSLAEICTTQKSNLYQTGVKLISHRYQTCIKLVSKLYFMPVSNLNHTYTKPGLYWMFSVPDFYMIYASTNLNIYIVMIHNLQNLIVTPVSSSPQ